MPATSGSPTTENIYRQSQVRPSEKTDAPKVPAVRPWPNWWSPEDCRVRNRAVRPLAASEVRRGRPACTADAPGRYAGDDLSSPRGSARRSLALLRAQTPFCSCAWNFLGNHRFDKADAVVFVPDVAEPMTDIAL